MYCQVEWGKCQREVEEERTHMEKELLNVN